MWAEEGKLTKEDQRHKRRNARKRRWLNIKEGTKIEQNRKKIIPILRYEVYEKKIRREFQVFLVVVTEYLGLQKG